ncbi:MAG: sigma-70 family RNA polymerase sigma factor [Clostridia bacterium]|nr:sigma-70 family RNA polymerase sigma factor [Clostridia bacterium]
MFKNQNEKPKDFDFDYIYHKYKNTFWRIIYESVNHDLERTQDIHQIVFGKLFVHFNKIEHEGAAVNWLKKTVKTTLQDEADKHRTYTHHVSIVLDNENTYESCDNVYENKPLDNVITKEELQIAIDVIQEMKPKYRDVGRLCFTEGYTHKEISDKLGISLRTVYRRAKKVKDMVLQALEDY